jgi:hypothetical protein
MQVVAVDQRAIRVEATPEARGRVLMAVMARSL